MSSHHIVREKQEPALLVLGLDDFPEELLGQLLEWSPTVITTPDTAEKLNMLGIKVDWVISNNRDEGLVQSDVKLMVPGDNTLATTALNYLIANHYPAVNVIMDEPVLDEMQNYTGKIDLVIFQGDQKIYTVSSGFSKWKPAGEEIRVLNSTKALNYTGLEQTGPDSFRTVEDGFFTLSFEQPFLWLAEGLD
ncbi:thiamine diphosphokinase [Mucilaginibacter sp. SG564]|uniref:thiamine diphosphokinase n=1 Tax=Mucilaginibacter sp. SG564 TaxID=2587022 RepID=UPI00155390BC|nr:thiamine diphosphokinase [Mucilaginibacter sp. SG564]NOW94493.1 thiamine pyrophosphokinase [Mucilaginibacter sp. SG564]